MEMFCFDKKLLWGILCKYFLQSKMLFKKQIENFFSKPD